MHKLKLGYLKEGDLVTINGDNFTALEPINLYAEAKKFLWKYPDMSWDNFTKVLVTYGRIEELEDKSIVNTDESFLISHISPNLFALEALLSNYDRVVNWLNGIEVGLVGTWMNMPRFHEGMKDLFIAAESETITESEFRIDFNKFIDEVKDLK